MTPNSKSPEVTITIPVRAAGLALVALTRLHKEKATELATQWSCLDGFARETRSNELDDIKAAIDTMREPVGRGLEQQARKVGS